MYVCVFMYLIVLIMIIVIENIVLYICRNLIARDFAILCNYLLAQSRAFKMRRKILNSPHGFKT